MMKGTSKKNFYKNSWACVWCLWCLFSCPAVCIAFSSRSDTKALNELDEQAKGDFILFYSSRIEDMGLSSTYIIFGRYPFSIHIDKNLRTMKHDTY